MELMLNLVWVCVAICGILVQIVMLSRVAATGNRQVSNWRKTVAMGCALVILFFVISMTDDLHDQALLLEESKLSRITAATETRAHFLSARSILVDFLFFHSPLPLAPPLPTVRRLVEPAKFVFAAAIECENLCGRAPPLSLA